MVRLRGGAGFEMDATGAYGVMGFIDGMTGYIKTPFYINAVLRHTHARLSNFFDLWLDAQAQLDPVALQHVYEWPQEYHHYRETVGNPAYRLWQHTLSGVASSAEASFNFLPSHRPSPINPILLEPGPTGKTVKPNIHVFVWKAQVMEYGLPVDIRLDPRRSPATAHAVRLRALAQIFPTTRGCRAVPRDGGTPMSETTNAPANASEQIVTPGEPADEQLGEGGKKALQAERDRAKELEKALNAATTKLGEIERANESTLEKAQREAQEAREALPAGITAAFRDAAVTFGGIAEEDAELFLTGTDVETLKKQAARLVERTPVAISAATTTSGFSGFLTPEQSGPIFETARTAPSFSSSVQQVPLGPSGVSIPVVTGKLTAGWVAEGAQKPASAGTMTLKTMSPKKLSVIAVVSAEVVRANPGGYMQEIRTQVGEAFATRSTPLRCTARSTPFTTYVDQTASSVEFTGTTPAFTAVWADLNSALSTLVNAGKTPTGWALDSRFEPVLNGVVDTAGRPLFIDSPLTETAGPVRSGRLMGRRVRRSRRVRRHRQDLRLPRRLVTGRLGRHRRHQLQRLHRGDGHHQRRADVAVGEQPRRGAR
jgi:HK97 family phage major capsid protein